jgi:hypothetical protein
MYSKNNHNFETSFNQTINLIKHQQNLNSQNSPNYQHFSTPITNTYVDNDQINQHFSTPITNTYVDNDQINQYGSGLAADFITKNTISGQELDIETKFTDNKLEITKFTTKTGTHGNYRILVDISGTKYTITQTGLTGTGSGGTGSGGTGSGGTGSGGTGSGGTGSGGTGSGGTGSGGTGSGGTGSGGTGSGGTGSAPKIAWKDPINIVGDITSTLPASNPFAAYVFSNTIQDPAFPLDPTRTITLAKSGVKEDKKCNAVKTWLQGLDKIPTEAEYNTFITNNKTDPSKAFAPFKLSEADISQCLKHYGVLVTESPYKFVVGNPVPAPAPAPVGSASPPPAPPTPPSIITIPPFSTPVNVDITTPTVLPAANPFTGYPFSTTVTPDSSRPGDTVTVALSGAKQDMKCGPVKAWLENLTAFPTKTEYDTSMSALISGARTKEVVENCLKHFGVLVTESPYKFEVGKPVLSPVVGAGTGTISIESSDDQFGGANELFKSRVIMVNIAATITTPVKLELLQFLLHKLVEHNFTNAIFCVCDKSKFTISASDLAKESIKFGYADSNSITLVPSTRGANIFGQTYFYSKFVVNVVALINPEDSGIQMKYASNKNISGLENLAKVLAISNPNRNYVSEGTLFDLLFSDVGKNFPSAINKFDIAVAAKDTSVHFVVVQNANQSFVKKFDKTSGKLLGYTNVTTPVPTEAANNVVVEADGTNFKLVNADKSGGEKSALTLYVHPHNNMNNYGDNNGYRLIDMLFSK